MRRISTAIGILALGVIGFGEDAEGALIVAYATANDTEVLAPTEVAAGVTALALSRGPGVEGAPGSTFNTRGWTEEAMRADDGYLQWGWNASQQPWNLEQLQLRYDRSASGPSQLEIQLAVNGGPFETVFTDLSVSAAGESQLDIPLPAASPATSATFRLHAFAAGSATGTFDLENFQMAPDRAISVHGTSVAAVPEASGWTMFLVALAGIWWKRRRGHRARSGR